MNRNDDGNYKHRGWTIVPEHQDVNGRRYRSGLWLCFAPGAERLIFQATTLQAAAEKSDAAMKEAGGSYQKRRRALDAMSVEELEQEYDRLLPILDSSNNEDRLEYIRDLLVAKRPDHQFRSWR